MARVYVSSTVADLEAERKAVIDWLVAADHQPVHSYRPDSETVRESCLQDVDGCDVRVNVPDIRPSDLLDPQRSELVRAFDAEVRREVRPAEFRDTAGLIQGLSTGVQHELDKLGHRRAAAPAVAPDDPRVIQIISTRTVELDAQRDLSAPR